MATKLERGSSPADRVSPPRTPGAGNLNKDAGCHRSPDPGVASASPAGPPVAEPPEHQPFDVQGGLFLGWGIGRVGAPPHPLSAPRVRSPRFI